MRASIGDPAQQRSAMARYSTANTQRGPGGQHSPYWAKVQYGPSNDGGYAVCRGADMRFASLSPNQLTVPSVPRGRLGLSLSSGSNRVRDFRSAFAQWSLSSSAGIEGHGAHDAEKGRGW